ncbi:hypothetical protein A2164_04275, partial [Candidatus Curtissbacteria bacterium RBG_13_35_7]
MKIGIDARFIGPQGTGIGKYTQKLIENLQNIDRKNKYSIFLKQSNWQLLKLKNKNFNKVLADIKWYSLEEQIKMPYIYKKQNLDLLHIPHFNVPLLFNDKYIVTIHDLIHRHFSQESVTTRNKFVFKAKRFAYKLTISSALKKSQKIITPSNYVKQEIIDSYKIDKSKIVVTYEAAEEEYSQNSKSKIRNPKFVKKFFVRKPFLIYVGNAYPHKNLHNLITAVEILNLKQNLKINLAIVCSRDIFWQRLKQSIEKSKIKKQIILTGYIKAKDLSILFSEAKAYVFPSLSEGFGIPGLNAMAAGLPVICSNIPTLKEVYANAACYFNPNDSE